MQDYVFSSTFSTQLTFYSLIAFVTYILFGPKPAVIQSTIGDELENEPHRQHSQTKFDKSLKDKSPATATPQIRRQPRKKVPRRVEVVETALGPVRVTIVGEPSAKGVLLSVHDIGVNHRTSFTRFFQFNHGEPRDTKVWEQFVQYHIDIPGHEEDAADLPDGVTLTMDSLAAAVLEVMVHLKLGAIVGFGVGAGANVLLRVALADPTRVRALMLIGPSRNRSSYSEKWQHWTLLQILKRYGMNSYAIALLTSYHFSASHVNLRSHVVVSYEETLKNHLNPRNVARYVEAYSDRDPIRKGALQRGLRSMKVLCMGSNGCGAPSCMPFLGGIDRITAAYNLYELLDHTRQGLCATWAGRAIAQRGNLVTEEKPEAIYQVVSLFLESVGFMAPL